MGRVKVASPPQPLFSRKHPNQALWISIALVLGIVAMVAVGAFLFSLGPLPVPDAPPFEVERFSGPVEIYSAETQAWTPMTRARVRELRLGASDKVKTGEHLEQGAVLGRKERHPCDWGKRRRDSVPNSGWTQWLFGEFGRRGLRRDCETLEEQRPLQANGQERQRVGPKEFPAEPIDGTISRLVPFV